MKLRHAAAASFFVGLLGTLAAVFALAPDALAYTLEVEQATQTAWKNQNLAEAEYNQNFSTNPYTFATTSNVMTKVAFLIKNEGASDCTGTSLVASYRYCVDATCSTGEQAWTNTNASATTSLAAGASAWVEYTISSGPQIRYITRLKPNTPSGGTNCGSLHQGLAGSDVFNGTAGNPSQTYIGNATTDDIAFRVYSGTADPRPGTVDVTDPLTATYPVAFPPASITAVSSVSYDEVGAVDGTMEFSIYHGATLVWTATAPMTAYAPAGNYFATVPLIYSFVLGEDYDVQARACFDGFSCSALSAAQTLTFAAAGSAAGGGGGGSWGDEGVNLSDFIEGLDDHDTVYGACKLFGWDAGVSESTSGDGLPCLWSWIKYALIPTDSGSVTLISVAQQRLLTRWPIAYLYDVWTAISTGLGGGGAACPLPVITDTEVVDITVPGFDFCDVFDLATETLAADDDLQEQGAAIVYLLGAMTAILYGFMLAKR